MFENDYILRMINQLVQTIIRIFQKIESEKIDEAYLDMHAACRRFLGLELDFLLSLSNQDLINIFGKDGEIDSEKCYIIAQLFFFEASIRDKKNDISSEGLHNRALELFLKSIPGIDKALKDDALSTIDRILLKTGEQRLSKNIYKLLIPYHEDKGEFGKAEDCIFELAETGCEDALQIGESFYSSVLDRSDTELEQGNLSRIEAEEGLKELRAKCSIQSKKASQTFV